MVWRGRGWAVPFLALIGFGTAEGLVEFIMEDATYYQRHSWPVLMGFLLAAFLIFLYAARFCPSRDREVVDPETGDIFEIEERHSFFLIPVHWWPWGSLVLGVILLASGYALGWDKSSPWDRKAFTREMRREVTGIPMPFAAGILTDGMDQRDSALSSDEEHFLYTLSLGGPSRILHLRLKDFRWSEPRVASFSHPATSGQRDLEPAFLPGTLELFFASDRPLPGEVLPDDFNLWRTSWTEKGWAPAVPVEGVNGDGNEFYPSLAADGTLYFTARREGGPGGEDLWMASPSGDGYSTPVPVPGALNTQFDEFNAAVHPDGRTLAFGSARPDGLGGGDLYFSRLQPDGTWSAGVLAPEPLNSERLDFSPCFQPDAEILWFTSNRKRESVRLDGPSLAALRVQWADRTSGGQDLYRIRYDLDAIFQEGDTAVVEAGPEDLTIAPTFPPQEDVEKIAREYFSYYLNQEYTSMLPLMAEDAVFEDPTMSLFGEPFRKEGAAAVVAWLEEVGSGVESVEFLIDHEFVTGPYLVMEGTYRTTAWGTAVGLPELHLTVEHRGITTLKVVEGKVVHHHDWIDYEEMWRQIDAAKAAQQD